MDELRLQDLTARVVAWHNRHPLARRITPAQVAGAGYVALPYADGAVEAGPEATAATPDAPAPDAPAPGPTASDAPTPGPAASDAPAPRTGRALRAVFSDDFIAPLAPRAVARWAARQGAALERIPVGCPLRAVPIDGSLAAPGSVPRLLYVMSAAIEVGTLRARVLVGRGARAAVLGPRLWSGQRIAVATAFGLALSIAAVTLALHAPEPGSSRAAALARPTGAAPVATSAHASGVAAQGGLAVAATPAAAVSLAPDAAGPRHVTALGSEPAAASAVSAAAWAPAVPAASAAKATQSAASAPVRAPGHAPRPPPEGSRWLAVLRAADPPIGRIGLPELGSAIGEEDKAAARRAVEDARRAAAHAERPTRVGAAAPGTPAAPAFALSTRALRTRAEAEQVQVAMGVLLDAVGGGPLLRTEILSEGDDWRVVGWPFARREQADQARRLLVSRGMRAEVVAF